MLIARTPELDKENRDEITWVRQKLKPHANYSRRPAQAPYVEFQHVSWSEKGGNIICVVPMGKESFRVLDDHSSTTADIRTIVVSSPSASIPIAAPNGAIVGTLSIVGGTNELALQKNAEVRGAFGTVTLSMNSFNLHFGNSFRTPTSLCPCVPTIGGAQPRNWDYQAFFYFDGSTLTGEIRQLSTALRSANLVAPMPALGAMEEIAISAPVDGGLVLRTTLTAPRASAALLASFILRDI